MSLQKGKYKLSNGEDSLEVNSTDMATGRATGVITVNTQSINVEMWYHMGSNVTTLCFSGGTGGPNSVHVGGTIISNLSSPNMSTDFSLATQRDGLIHYKGEWLPN